MKKLLTVFVFLGGISGLTYAVDSFGELWRSAYYLETPFDHNYNMKCHPFFVETGTIIFTSATSEITGDIYVEGAEEEWQDMCVCDERFKPHRDKSDSCAALDFSRDGSGICECFARNSGTYKNSIFDDPSYEHGLGYIMSTNSIDFPGKDRTIVILSQYSVFPEREDAPNPVETEAIFDWKAATKLANGDIWVGNIENRHIENTITQYSYCGDNTIQVYNMAGNLVDDPLDREDCDDGALNGQPGYCAANCQGGVGPGKTETNPGSSVTAP